MPYNFAANSFHTKKLSFFSRLSSSEVRFYTEITRETPFEGLRGNVR